MKRLLVTSTDLMMVQFLVPHIINLSENGYEIDIVCSEVGGRLSEVRAKLNNHIKSIHKVRLKRNPLSPGNLLGYLDMKKLLAKEHYDVVWTNEPVMGVVTRLCANKYRKNGTKVLYMSHGFHFFEGAPLLNWMIYYPIERIASRWCDAIAVINHPDYEMACRFHQNDTFHIHGIGVNTDRLNNKNNQCNLREELHLNDDDMILLSVGELNRNKNHQVVIRAVAELNNPKLHYVICGRGGLLKELQQLCLKLGVNENVHFMGYRKDVVSICSQSDIFAFPTLREGLGLAPLEAMYCGLPIVASDTRGPQDYVINGKTGFLVEKTDPKAFASAIDKLINDNALRLAIGNYNKQYVVPYCLGSVKEEVSEIIDCLNK